jgi:CTP synthase (UTP-ammonia lyase)
VLRIGIIGDFNPQYHTHVAIDTALAHTAAWLGERLESQWVPTPSIAALGASRALAGFDALWASPASPYASAEGMLLGIQFARAQRVPFTGTWGGFQYALVEHARHVLGIADADTAENNSGSQNLVITPFLCTVPVAPGDPPFLHDLHPIRLLPGSRLHAIYGAPTIQAGHLCNYGVNPDYLSRFEAAGVRIAGIGEEGDIRAIELPDHRFYVATLFHPQLESRPGRPSPLVLALLDAARGRAASAGA